MNSIQDELVALRTGQVSPKCSGEYWSDEDQKKLCDLFWNGCGISEMAISLHRTEFAIYQQLLRREMFKPQCRPRNRQKKSAAAECLCQYCSIINCNHRRKENQYAGTL